jgi:hypothetical protein
MTASITFFPVDNGDMTLVQLADPDATAILIDMKIREAADDRGVQEHRHGVASASSASSHSVAAFRPNWLEGAPVGKGRRRHRR